VQNNVQGTSAEASAGGQFSGFRLPKPILKSLERLSFTTPTPIQEAAIPIVMSGGDVIACAETGSGKTAAYSVPIVARLLDQAPSSKALILVPTRELAQQVFQFWSDLTRSIPGFRAAVVVGGASLHQQARVLRGKPRVLIATPGRLVDHLKRGSTRLDGVVELVLDEADRMLDMGFSPQLRQIRQYLKGPRQTLLFSATWASSLEELAGQYVQNPQRIQVGRQSQAAVNVKQSMVETTVKAKSEDLLDQLNQCDGSVMVFTKTKIRADKVTQYLASFGVKVGHIHGGRSQGQRNAALRMFKAGSTQVLVATDLVARGIDIPSVSHVINYDLPQAPEDYIHRIGRTGRAGASGHAISMLTPEDHSKWRDILGLLKQSGSALPEGCDGFLKSRKRPSVQRFPKGRRRRGFQSR
jgi:superfamily II DNA/RNA helicase